jgi:DNA polymerase elongation subunit (family B)
LGVKKVVHRLGFKAMWEQEPDEYVFYNGVDSILVREIDKKLKTSQTFFTLANLLHVPALVAFSPVRSLETVQTEYLYKEGKVFPKVNKENITQKSYTGAYVYEPTPGVYKNIIALDFASLYPSTIRQFNISPDTYKGMASPNYVKNKDEIKTISGAIYERNRDGFIPKILTDFYSQRKIFKHEMQIAEKEKGELEEILERRLKSCK